MQNLAVELQLIIIAELCPIDIVRLQQVRTISGMVPMAYVLIGFF